jgi:hypothetical protein
MIKFAFSPLNPATPPSAWQAGKSQAHSRRPEARSGLLLSHKG